MSFAEKLKRAMTEKNISQAELARKVGLKRSTINGYLSGRRTKISVPVLNSIMRALDMDALEVMNDCGDLFESVTEDDLQALEEAIRGHSFGISLHLAAPSERIDRALLKLNTTGQNEAAKRVEELTEIPRYTEPEE